ncbi:MAG TPA: hypothetical protein DHU90_02485 [Sphingobacterium sp.]|uniref:Uncharacterized protein n=2 Tax=Sphingobacterium TaxID=28453 RepID=A0A363NSM2_9SPHI|nr:hypothetical protein DCO56_17765 [Sphingobacterium athyrii]RKO73682.1 hypothetical protein D7322_00180 [Sphingobacterium puteale]HAL51367.1 hypothetical protein [Sphingobacterium sp.]HAU51850.1 hypothetical protein [Sphingobacterium sp.]HBI87248.1 hypothetical protein [Sphingobacterium sp.]
MSWFESRSDNKQ